MASSRPTFPFLISLTCVLYDGGQRPGSKGPNSQLWHSFVVASPPEDTFIDGVTSDDCYTTVAFWEPDIDRRPIESCVAIIIGEAAFLPKGPIDPTNGDKMMKVQGIQVLVLPSTAGDDNMHNHPKYTPPMITLMGHVGAGKEHSSGFRSFEVACSAYNTDNSGQPRQFTVRCFFDFSPRWKAYTIPRRGSVVHVVGAWVGRYALEGETGQFQPAILVMGGFKTLGADAAADSSAATSPTMSSPRGAIPRFAPPGYLGPRPLPPLTPTTPSRSQTTPRPSTEHTPIKTHALDAGKEGSSDSGVGSHQTLSNTNGIDDDDGLDGAPSFQDGVLGSAMVKEHSIAAAAANKSPRGSRKRRRGGE